jgi:hypothetical protein
MLYLYFILWHIYSKSKKKKKLQAHKSCNFHKYSMYSVFFYGDQRTLNAFSIEEEQYI